MTMTFKEALIAHLQGEKVEVAHGGRQDVYTKFEEWHEMISLSNINDPNWCIDLVYRLAPRTILVNGVEVPAGEKEAPSKGATYYVPDQAEESLAYDFSWGDDEMDARFLERGLVYLDRESAIARAKAMLITQEVK